MDFVNTQMAHLIADLSTAPAFILLVIVLLLWLTVFVSLARLTGEL